MIVKNLRLIKNPLKTDFTPEIFYIFCKKCAHQTGSMLPEKATGLILQKASYFQGNTSGDASRFGEWEEKPPYVTATTTGHI